MGEGGGRGETPVDTFGLMMKLAEVKMTLISKKNQG